MLTKSIQIADHRLNYADASVFIGSNFRSSQNGKCMLFETVNSLLNNGHWAYYCSTRMLYFLFPHPTMVGTGVEDPGCLIFGQLIFSSYCL